MGELKRLRGRFGLAAVAVLVSVLACVAPGRADPTAVSGSVTDVFGQPLAGVEVELRGTGGSAPLAHAVSDAQGRFSLRPVEPGDYVLVARKAGFAPAADPVVLPVAPDKKLSLALAPEELETVTVEAPRLGGPSVSPSGANQYTVTAQDIDALPAGANTALTDVLAQMPGVAIDQNQQIHIRNTEGPQFQYQINGVLVPLDINTNPPFLSMINPLFIKQLESARRHPARAL